MILLGVQQSLLFNQFGASLCQVGGNPAYLEKNPGTLSRILLHALLIYTGAWQSKPLYQLGNFVVTLNLRYQVYYLN